MKEFTEQECKEAYDDGFNVGKHVSKLKYVTTKLSNPYDLDDEKELFRLWIEGWKDGVYENWTT